MNTLAQQRIMVRLFKFIWKSLLFTTGEGTSHTICHHYTMKIHFILFFPPTAPALPEHLAHLLSFLFHLINSYWLEFYPGEILEWGTIKILIPDIFQIKEGTFKGNLYIAFKIHR